MWEESKIRAIHFDLDTNKLKAMGISRSSAYTQIRNVLEGFGFERRQFSGYYSLEPIEVALVDSVVLKLGEKLEWLSKAIKAFDVSIINHEISYIDMIKQNSLISDEINIGTKDRFTEQTEKSIEHEESDFELEL